jgi:hypothetical protein
MNENWPRWIFASVSKHFSLNVGDLPIFYEGHKRSAEFLESDLIEFRMDGPYFLLVSRGLWTATIEVNILLQTSIDDNDFHKIHRNVGIVAKAFTDIIIYRYGEGIDDDDSYLSCLGLMQSDRKRELLSINHFGQIDPSKQLMQATVEGHYKAELTV